VDEDDIELMVEAQGSHVAWNVFAVGIEGAADGEHLGGKVGEGGVGEEGF